MRLRREAELAGMRSIAEVAQRVLLRPVPRSAGHLRAAVSYTSAVAEARIGGDLYEVVSAPGGVRVIIGDVQGKGLESVETAAVVLGAFREAAHDEPDLKGVGARVERAAGRALEGEKFVTAIIAELDPANGAVFLNYGHPPPLSGTRRRRGVLPRTRPVRPPARPGARHGRGPPALPGPLRPRRPAASLHGRRDGGPGPVGRVLPPGRPHPLLKDPDPEAALEALRRDLILHTEGPLHDDAAMLLLRHRE